MPRRSRFFLCLVFPPAVLLWLIGWLLYWAGSRGMSNKNATMLAPDTSTFLVLMPEEKQVPKDHRLNLLPKS
jgi:hypothetical protein